MNSSRASSLAIRSSSRWRNRVSTSDSPWCLSGGGRSDFASSVNAVHPQRQLAAAGAKRGPVDAEQIAEVEAQQPLHPVASELVDARLELDPPGAVDEIEERHLALAATGRQPSRDAVRRVGLLAVE